VSARAALAVLFAVALVALGCARAEAPAATETPHTNRSPVHLALIWHQHQPLYLDPATDGLRAPWVRTHATKDYFDMAAMIGRYPRVHATINLTSTLLLQLQSYYVERIGPFVSGPDDAGPARIDAAAFLARWRGRTDPWIDLALTPTEDWDDADLKRVIGGGWSARSVSPVIAARWPAMTRLLEAVPDSLDRGDLRSLLAHFYVLNFDPDFLRGPVKLPDGGRVDLSDIVAEPAPNRFRFRAPPSLPLTRRLVAESWRVMAAVVPQHRALRYDPGSGEGQIELITTPFTHPILPLLVDSDLAAWAQPGEPLPKRFAFPEDADLQVRMGAATFERLFGAPPAGFWPAEGSVAEAVIAPLAGAGLRWIATDQEVLRRSSPSGRLPVAPYRVDSGKEPGSAPDERMLAVFFRDTDLSDRIGFDYQSGPPDGEETAADFVDGVLEAAAEARRAGALAVGDDVLITVILDGENAWEWYRNDPDGKGFLDALYRRLERLDRAGVLRTVTPSEYLSGNPRRGIAAHRIADLPELEPLWAGSWIGASFATWIGEDEENAAWEALGAVRSALAATGIAPPDPRAPVPAPGSIERAEWEAWQAMLAAEGSDWFWWYGADQEIGGGDDPFDRSFRALLAAVDHWAARAGHPLGVGEFESFLVERGERAPALGGTMARARSEVLFEVDCSALEVAERIYVVGGDTALGSWIPNRVAMRDDGRAGDRHPGDGIWSLRVALPQWTEVEYKFSNSGPEGSWAGEEFALENRRLAIEGEALTVRVVFGVR